MAFNPALRVASREVQWLKSKIEECPSPVPTALVDLVQNYARRAVAVPGSPAITYKLDEAFLLEHLAFPNFLKRVDIALLCLYYVLCQKEACACAKCGEDYSHKFYSSLPVRFLLTLMDERGWGSDSDLIVKLLGYVAVLCPQDLPNFESMIYGVGREVEAGLVSFKPDSYQINPRPFHEAPILEQCRRLSELVLELNSTKRRSNEGERQLKRSWCRQESLLPRQLYAAVYRGWLSAIGSDIDYDEALLRDPTVLFRVDDRLLLSPLHVWCAVRMLAHYLSASASEGHLKLLACKTHGSVERYQEAYNLACIQNSVQSMAVVCLLLELAGKAERAEVPLVRKIVCEQIHRMFMEEPKLVQLVHYHGYPLELIPIMVEHVPSVHILIATVNELLLYPDAGRRLFGVHLIARLVDKYRTPSAFAGVKLIGDMLDTELAQRGLDDELVGFLDAALPALVLIIKISPLDVASLRATLGRVVKMLRSRLALLTCDWQPADAATKDKQLLDGVSEALKMADSEAAKKDVPKVEEIRIAPVKT